MVRILFNWPCQMFTLSIVRLVLNMNIRSGSFWVFWSPGTVALLCCTSLFFSLSSAHNINTYSSQTTAKTHSMSKYLSIASVTHTLHLFPGHALHEKGLQRQYRDKKATSHWSAARTKSARG